MGGTGAPRYDGPRPWLDADRAPAERVAALLDVMTLEEKVAQLAGVWVNETNEDHEVFAEVARTGDLTPLGLPSRIPHGVGQLTRPFGAGPLPVAESATVVNAIQRWLADETRLGIPALVHEECLTGFMTAGATTMPSPLNWGATFDPNLIGEMAAVIGDQLAAAGAHQGLAPVLDVIRDHRWGRTEECIGEDPYLIGTIGTAYVQGLQADGSVLATVKHFLGHGSPEGGHNTAPVHAGLREVADTFAVPFEMAIKQAQPGAVMSGYHDLDGVPVTADPSLLTGLLRDRWGYEGMVVSDYWALNFLWHHHFVTHDERSSAVLALRAGVDVELPKGQYHRTLIDAVADGEIAESLVDRACARVLDAKVRLELFERPTREVHTDLVLDTPEARSLARRVAASSITLLHNDGTLPLPATEGLRIAVIGPDADVSGALLGNYTFRNHIAYRFEGLGYDDAVAVPTVYEAIAATALAGSTVTTAAGCAVTGDDRSQFSDAIALASDADVCIAVVGDQAGHFLHGTVGEGTDSSHLNLPGVQEELVLALADTGTPVVVVHVAGRPHDLSRVVDRAAAIVEAWFPGEEGAAAVADVLFGVVNPGGRTPVSFTRGAGQQPYWYGAKFLSRVRYVDETTRPVFCFGHGLSYTTFAYDNLSVAPTATTDGTIAIRCTVSNTGDRAGDEVVQLYVTDPAASVARPTLELRGFARVHLEPGQTADITFDLPAAHCSFTGPTYERIVEPGELIVTIGASSRDHRLVGTTVLTGPTRVLGEDRPLTCPVIVTIT